MQTTLGIWALCVCIAGVIGLASFHLYDWWSRGGRLSFREVLKGLFMAMAVIGFLIVFIITP